MPLFGDDFVRAVAVGISAHPEWASWLVTDGLIQRFVASVEAIADGYSPSSELGFVATNRPFLVREDEGRLVIAAGTYRRYDLVAEVLGSLDAEATVVIFKKLEPAILEARRDVAWHRGSFDDRLQQAIDHLLEVEIPDGVIEVERRTRTYAYAEDDFEHMSGAQRHLLRMGRSNAMAVQSKLREIRSAFGWPAVPPPADVRYAVTDGEEDLVSQPVVIAEAIVDPPESKVSEEVTFSPVVEPTMTIVDAQVLATAPPMLVATEQPSVTVE